jgi:hypothetical protein
LPAFVLLVRVVHHTQEQRIEDDHHGDENFKIPPSYQPDHLLPELALVGKDVQTVLGEVELLSVGIKDGLVYLVSSLLFLGCLNYVTKTRLFLNCGLSFLLIIFILTVEERRAVFVQGLSEFMNFLFLAVDAKLFDFDDGFSACLD